ncbi:hypothetical protein KW803_02530 [Candidatus Saccharibacteria bacterium]|nr:hypothetical protein [Candidatus Saccharibacteria bacterium]
MLYNRNMTLGHEFGTPRERKTTIYLEHVAGFEVSGVNGYTVFITPADLENDADTNPVNLRAILDSGPREIGVLSDEYLLRNLIIPNLPIGILGDPSSDPVILSAEVGVAGPEPSNDHLEYARSTSNRVYVYLTPSLGELAGVSIIREPRLGRENIDWFQAGRAGASISLYGGAIQAQIGYDRSTPESFVRE